MLADSIFLVRNGIMLDRQALCTASVPEHMALVRDAFRDSLDFTNCEAWSTSARIGIVGGTEGKASVRAIYAFLNTLKDRSTTKADDEAIVLAVAFRLFTGPVTSSKGEERMCAFYQAMREIPLHWLFLGLPLLSVAGFTSAPKTLRVKNSPIHIERFPHTERRLVVTQYGIEGSVPTILLKDFHKVPIGQDIARISFSTASSEIACTIILNPSNASRQASSTMLWKPEHFDGILLQSNNILRNDTTVTGLLIKLSSLDGIKSNRATATTLATTSVQFSDPRNDLKLESSPAGHLHPELDILLS